LIRNRLVAVLVVTLLLIPMGAAHARQAPTATEGWSVQDGDLLIEFTPESPDDAVTLLSASGCNVDVCIYLTGSGLTVDRWRTTGYVTSNECSRARFWANGSIVKASSLFCPSSSGTLSATWESPGRFANGTQACNSWTNVTGYPCKTISR
jgi:hypothetical protein